MGVDVDEALNIHAAAAATGIDYGTLRYWATRRAKGQRLRTRDVDGQVTTTLADVETFLAENPKMPAVAKVIAARAAAGPPEHQDVLQDLARMLGDEPLLADRQQNLVDAVVRRIGSGTPLTDLEVGLHRDLLVALGVIP